MSEVVTLVLGGARSGKSACAERLARESGRRVLYVATATAGDDEMAVRIAAHQAQRPTEWRTIEAPDHLLQSMRGAAHPGDAVLIDCLTLWVSNVILREVGPAAAGDALPVQRWATIEASLVNEALALVAEARERDIALYLVSNEVGMGVVPPFPLGRRFQDILGRVNQAIAGAADVVILLIAGLPVDLRKLTDARLAPEQEGSREEECPGRG